MIQFKKLLEQEKYDTDFLKDQKAVNNMLGDTIKKMLLHGDTEYLLPYIDGDEAWERAVSDAAKLRTVSGLFIDGLTELEEGYEVGTLSPAVLRDMSRWRRLRLNSDILEILRQVEKLGIFAGCVELGSIMYDKNWNYAPYIKNVHHFQMGGFPQTWQERNGDEYELPFFDQDLQNVANTRLTAKIQATLSDNIRIFRNEKSLVKNMDADEIYSTEDLIKAINNVKENIEKLKSTGQERENLTSDNAPAADPSPEIPDTVRPKYEPMNPPDTVLPEYEPMDSADTVLPEHEPMNPSDTVAAGYRRKAAVCTVVAPCTSEQGVQFYYKQIAMLNSTISAAMDKGGKPVYAAYAWSGSKQDGFTTNTKEFGLFDKDYIPNLQYREEACDMSQFMQSYMTADAMMHLFDEDSDMLLYVLLPIYDNSNVPGKITHYVKQLRSDLGERLNVVYLYGEEQYHKNRIEENMEEPWIKKYTINNPEHLKQMFGQVEEFMWKGVQ